MADEDDVVQVALLKQAHDVVDVGRQVGVGRGEVGTFAHACQIESVHDVAALFERIGDLVPHPSTEPEAGDEDIGSGVHDGDARLDSGQNPPGIPSEVSPSSPTTSGVP